MSATQNGTAGLTVGGQAAKAAVYITVPSGAIVESIEEDPGGAVERDDQMDADGAFHTRITYEKRMQRATITLVGKEYTKNKGDMDGNSSAYYVEDVQRSTTKGPVKTVITVCLLPTISTTTSTTAA